VYVCVCMCMYVYVCVCMCMYVYVCVCMCMHLRDKRHSNQCFAFKKMQNILFWPKSILWKGSIFQNEREFRLISSILATNAVEAWHLQQFPVISVNVEHFMKQNLLFFKCGPAPQQQSLWGSLFCITHVVYPLFETISPPSHHPYLGLLTKGIMTLVQCRGCLFCYSPGYLKRHPSNSPQCLVLTQQGQEVEPEQGNQPMMEGGEEDSESGSMVFQRVLAGIQRGWWTHESLGKQESLPQ
jgi:hypothetical protein